MIPEAAPEATQMEPLLAPAIRDRKLAILQRISKAKSMPLCCNCCPMITQRLWKAVEALALSTLGLAFAASTIRMRPVRIVRFHGGRARKRLEQMSHIRMIAHVFPNQVNRSSSSLQLDSFTGGLSDLDKQLAVSTQYLLMGDSRITWWRSCMSHFHETFDPGIMQPESQKVWLGQEQALVW